MPHRSIRLLGFCLSTLAAASLAAGPTPPRNAGNDWPTLHGDLTRSGFYPRFPRGPLRLAWRRELHQELTGPRAEVIVGDGLAFMGTYAGRMYAWDARTGTERWSYPARGPIGHSPTWANHTLYFGSMDRHLYALGRDGKPKWSFEAEEGVWTSPAVFAGQVLFGDRGGTFYSLRTADGRAMWKFPTGAPILAPASLSEDGSRVLVASEDMHVYCLDRASGRLLWKSRKLPGLSLRDHAPTVFHGIMMITTNPVKDFHTTLGEQEQLLLARTGFRGKDNRYIPGTEADVRQEQDGIVDFVRRHPSEQTFFAFRVADGTEPWIAPILYTAGLHNPPTPPCYNPLTGDVFVLLRSAYSVWDGGGEVRSYIGVGKLDLATGRVRLIEHGHRSTEPGRPAGRKDMPYGTFNTIGDETQSLSCSPDWLFSNHQGNLGSMNLANGLTVNQWGKRDSYGGFYGPANFGWEDQGGPERARKAGQPYGLVNEWHGPDRAIVSVAGKYVYFPVGSQVLCLEGGE